MDIDIYLNTVKSQFDELSVDRWFYFEVFEYLSNHDKLSWNLIWIVTSRYPCKWLMKSCITFSVSHHGKTREFRSKAENLNRFWVVPWEEETCWENVPKKFQFLERNLVSFLQKKKKKKYIKTWPNGCLELLSACYK